MRKALLAACLLLPAAVGAKGPLTSAAGSAAYTIASGVALASGTGLNTYTHAESGSVLSNSVTFSVTDTNSTAFLIFTKDDTTDAIDPATTPPTVSGGTLTWSLVSSAYLGGRYMTIFKATSAAAIAAQTVTVTCAAGSTYYYGQIAAVAFKGVTSLGTPVVLVSGNHGYADTVSVTTTAANGWVFAAGYEAGAGTITLTVSTTSLATDVAHDGQWVGYDGPVSTGTYTLGSTVTGGDVLAIGVELKP